MEIEEILACFTRKGLKKKEYFLKEGQFIKSIGFLENGSLICFQIVNGEDKISDFAFENDRKDQAGFNFNTCLADS